MITLLGCFRFFFTQYRRYNTFLQEQMAVLKKENEELRTKLSRPKTSADTLRVISKLQTEIEELKTAHNEVQSTNANLYQSLCKKNDSVKSLEVGTK